MCLWSARDALAGVASSCVLSLSHYKCLRKKNISAGGGSAPGRSNSGCSSCLWTPTDGWGRDFGLGLGTASDEQGFSLHGNAVMLGSVTEGGRDSPWWSTVNCLAFFRGSHKWRLLWLLLLVPPGHLPARTPTESHHFPWHGGVLVFFLSPLLKTNKQTKKRKKTKTVRWPGSKATQTQCHSGIK